LVTLFYRLASFSGIVGGILLLIAGEWPLLLLLLLGGVFAPYGVSVAMLPSIILSLPAASLMNNGYHFLSKAVVWLGSVYVGLVFAAWSSFIFVYVMNSTETFWGGILASFGTAVSPMAFFSSKEPRETQIDAAAQTLGMLTCQIALLSMIVMGVLNGGSLYEIGTVYFTVYVVLTSLRSILLSAMLSWINAD